MLRCAHSTRARRIPIGVQADDRSLGLERRSAGVALVIETSSDIQMMAPVIHGMGSIFTETVMALNGGAAVITYDSTVDVRQPFKDDHDPIASAISNVEFETPEMRLYDAMAEAMDMLKARLVNHRHVLLIVGESQDIASDAKLGLVSRDAELANVAIYAVGPSVSFKWQRPRREECIIVRFATARYAARLAEVTVRTRPGYFVVAPPNATPQSEPSMDPSTTTLPR